MIYKNKDGTTLRRIATWFAILSIGFMANTLSCIAEEVGIKIINGEIDLRNYDLNTQIIQADGEWKFKFSEHVKPENVNSTVWDIQETYRRKAGWNKQRNHDNFPALGYGTYYTRIYLNNKVRIKDVGFLLRLPKTSAKMYLNGQLADSSGNPGKSIEETISSQKPLIGGTSGDTEFIDVVVHVSNFAFNRGGIDESLFIGKLSKIKEMQAASISMLMFSCGALLFVGLYHGILFLFRFKNKEVLILSLFSIAIAIRMLILKDKPFIYIFGDVSAEIALKFEFWTVFFAMPILYSYYYYIFPKYFNRTVSNIYLSVSAAITLMSVFISCLQYSKLIPIFELYILVTYLMIIFCLLKAIFKSAPYSVLFFCGFLVIFLGSLNDILFERGILKGGFIIQYAIFIFVICQAILIGKRFSDSQNNLEISNSDLEKLKNSLEEIVEERTGQLKLAHETSEKAHAEVKLLSNSIMNLLEDERKAISRELHDDFGQAIRAAGLYSESVIKLLKKEPNPALQQCIENAEKIQSALAEVYNKNRNLLKRLRPEIMDTLGLNAAIEELLDSYRKVDYEIRFLCDAEVDRLDNKQKMTIYRILQESITNIVKHANSNEIDVALTESVESYFFVVSDKGQGFDTKENAKGIGLISMRERLSEIGGSIDIQSEKGKGTIVTATIPK